MSAPVRVMRAGLVIVGESEERASRYEKAARDSWSFARVALAVGRCDHGITV